MPATEQTRYHMPLLHKLFALSSVLLLVATVWVFSRDHFRSWKQYQRTSERIETKLARWQQLQLLTDDVATENAHLRQALSEVMARSFPADELEDFRESVRADAVRRNSATPSFVELDGLLENLEQVTQEARQTQRYWQQCRLASDRAVLEAEDATARLRDATVDEAVEGSSTTADEILQGVKEAVARARETVAVAAEAMYRAQANVVPVRKRVLDELAAIVAEARFREEEWARRRKEQQASLVVEKARLGIGARDALSREELQQIQESIDGQRQQVEELSRNADAAKMHRDRLQSLLNALTEPEQKIRQRLTENSVESRRIETLLAEKRSTYVRFWGIVPLPGKKWLELPFLDAFNSPRQVDNLWSEGLDRPSGSFGRVRRFDRCTTCHQRIDTETAVIPPEDRESRRARLAFSLRVPSIASDDAGEGDVSPDATDLKSLYGFSLAKEGLLNQDSATVQWVELSGPADTARPWESLGMEMRAGDIRESLFQTHSDVLAQHAPTGLRMGDVIHAINDQPVPAGPTGRAWVTERLRLAVEAPQDSQRPIAVKIEVSRGLVHPFAGHPRQDLFVKESSPHKMSEFACTICHEGQGSATDFEWASHTPNGPATRRRWRAEYGWSENPDWEFPMLPNRFVESSCLKCHHDVVELQQSSRHPQSPAAKVTQGYRLIRNLGCYGCHEIEGYHANGERIGPDLRLEPNYAEVALQFKGAKGTGFDQCTENERTLVDRLVAEPDNETLRRAVYAMLSEDAALAALDLAESDTDKASDPRQPMPRFSGYVHRTLLPLLQRHKWPGTLRKVGPSLRFVRHKLDSQFLGDWIRQPTHFRPSTTMPQSFGLWNHLPAEQARIRRAELLAELELPVGQRRRMAEEINADLAAVEIELQSTAEIEKRFEPVAIFSMVQYLQRQSQRYQYIEPPTGITPIETDDQIQQQLQRGKVAFEELGCLACHDHVDFPEIRSYRDADSQATGPELTDLATKFAANRNPQGARWLYSWIQQPTRYSTRTTMPELLIEPVQHRDADGNVTHVTDPIADIVSYLLSTPSGRWQPSDFVPSQLQQQDLEALRELALVYLEDVFPDHLARVYLEQGIPYELSGQVTNLERSLVFTPSERASWSDDLLTQKQIDYVARKAITTSGCFACHDIPGMEDAKSIGPGLNNWGRKATSLLSFGHVSDYLRHGQDSTASDRRPAESAAESVADVAKSEADSQDFFVQQLAAGTRIGFLHQKLAEPRSFDYFEARNKKYTQRLRMPQFLLSETEREAIMTFVLGLVADPPQPKYVYSPDPSTQALWDGSEVLTKYSCRNCHLLETDTWRLAFKPDTIRKRPPATNYPFVEADFDRQQILQSLHADEHGMREAELHGFPALSSDGLSRIYDDEEFPIEEEEDEPFELDRLIYSFDLWRPALIDGQPFQVGQGAIDLQADQIDLRQAARGGTLTKYLLPRLVIRERDVNPNVNGNDVWGWLPPVLVGEGSKVQSQWLLNYLLNPTPIRPAAVMRMPRYNLSSREAKQLVDYFVAGNSTAQPYDKAQSYGAEPARSLSHLTAAEQRYADKLAAMRKSGSELVGDLLGGGNLPGVHLAGAMKIVTDDNYCVKCHRIGEFDPPGTERVKAPDLTVVYQRLRTDYLRRWLAQPTSIQPYTPMPVNIPYDPTAPLEGTTVPQDLYHGTSTEQLEALVDLLMNYDRFAREAILPTVLPVDQ